MYLREGSKKYRICPYEVIPFIGLNGPKPFERVYMSPALNGDDYTFIYEYMVTQFCIQFPLSSFECQMLTEMQTVPSQLHPNTWGFLQAFQIVCKYFSIKQTINKFMFFYQMKYGESIGWISLSPASSRLKLFSLYKNSFNAFKDAFFKVKARKTDLSRRILFNENYAPRFTLYWLIPTKFKSRTAHQLTAQEKLDIQFQIDFMISYDKPLPTKDLMDSVDVKEPDQYLKGE